MNRLVLIGNGFDIAHGLHTSYKNFICWYWLQWGNRLLSGKNKTESDGLCSFILRDNIEVPNWGYIWGSYYQRENPLKPWDANEIIQMAMNDRKLCEWKMEPLLNRITKSFATKKWVDIENDYYSLLTEEKITMKGYIIPNYKELNNQLDYIRLKLIDYLKIENEKDTVSINEVEDKIYQPIRKREVALASKVKMNYRNSEVNSISKIMLLNFNYTKTPELYKSKRKNVSINYIHGRIDIPDSVIFGYGDELDSSFQKLKDYNNNECLRYIKSIRYLESDNYRKMLEFIESAPFQVCIMGHSCGNSDRTLLNTLFEHRNCVSVKPYYYIDKDGKDNYLDLVQNISRNFTDMKLMRDRVVNKTYCEPLTK